MYKKLYTIRTAEEYIIEHYDENLMRTPMHMSHGQEAIAVGVISALSPEDQVMCTYRSHAVFLAKTNDLDLFFLELYGKDNIVAGGKAGSMHLADPERGHMGSTAIVGSGISTSVGIAFANKYKKNGNISVSFFGDGALDEGTFWESINLACLMGLPVLFVCEDNGLAVHTSKDIRQGYRNIDDIIKNFDIGTYLTGEASVYSINSVTKRAIEDIKKIVAPAFLRIPCFRNLEHVGVNEDFEAGYRSRDFTYPDCLIIERQRLLSIGVSMDKILDIENTIYNRVIEAAKNAIEASYPTDLYGGVYYEGA
jgi:pyruvate dehydrogenase E1 component alpha subunit